MRPIRVRVVVVMAGVAGMAMAMAGPITTALPPTVSTPLSVMVASDDLVGSGLGTAVGGMAGVAGVTITPLVGVE